MSRIPALLVTHADLGAALLRAAEQIYGPVDGRRVSSRTPSSRRTDARARRSASASRAGPHGGLVLTDFPGGSCQQCGLLAARGNAEIVVVTGHQPAGAARLPAQPRAATRVAELAERLMTRARDSVRVQRAAARMSWLNQRVDDRLIHGQVVVAWGAALRPARLYVVDDQVAASPWERDLLVSAAPDVEVRVLTVAEAAAAWRGRAGRAGRRDALVRDLRTARALVEAGAAVPAFTLGGLHYAPGKTKIAEYVYLDEADRADARALLRARRGARGPGRAGHAAAGAWWPWTRPSRREPPGPRHPAAGGRGRAGRHAGRPDAALAAARDRHAARR